jgi:hypothetical protein
MSRTFLNMFEEKPAWAGVRPEPQSLAEVVKKGEAYRVAFQADKRCR